jgi:hypothetical protein
MPQNGPTITAAASVINMKMIVIDDPRDCQLFGLYCKCVTIIIMTVESVNDASRSVIVASRVTLQIMASLTIVIYDCKKLQ